MTENVQITSNDKTLWEFAKQKLKEVQGENARITNQQIVDAMKAIAKANGQENGDFDKYANDHFRAGEEIEVPGFHLEHGKVEVIEDEPEVAATEAELAEEQAQVAEDGIPTEDNRSMVSQMGMGAFALKGMAKTYDYMARGYGLKYVKDKAKAQGKGMKDVAKKQFSKLEGKIAKTKAQNIRNTAASKASDYRKALNNWKAEDAKLKELKTKQNKLKAAKQRMNKLKPGFDKDGKKITDKNLIETRKANKAKGLDKVNKEIEALQKEIDKQKDKVGKANAKKVATKEAYDASKRKVTKDVNKAVGRTASGKLTKTTTKAAGKEATKAAGKAGAKKVTTKAATKAVAKAGGKTLIKKVPLLGVAAGLVFAADRLAHGDVTGAVGEVASGVASCVPGVGTAVSVGIDAALAAKDLKDAKVI